jgi:hypothetical protein
VAEDRLAEDLVTIEWPIEAYLRTLRYKLDHRTDAIDLVSEAEDHLREAAERLLDRGYGRVEAESTALARLGEPDLVAALLATKAQPGHGSRLDRLRRHLALIASASWLVTVIVYIGQALHQPWQLDHFQIWCNVATATLGVTAAPLLSQLKPHLLMAGVLAVVFALLWQQDAETGWRWWTCGTAVGLIALGGLQHRRHAASLAVALAWPLAFAIQHAGKAMQIGPLDDWGEPIYVPLIAYAVGATLTAVGLAAGALRYPNQRSTPLSTAPATTTQGSERSQRAFAVTPRAARAPR